MQRYRIILPLWAVYVAMIGALSLMPGDAAPSPDVSDKLLHGAAYLLMAVLAPWDLRSARTAVLTTILLFGYGVCLELAQGAFTRTRSPEVLDALANGAGALVGVLLRRGIALVKHGKNT